MADRETGDDRANLISKLCELTSLGRTEAKTLLEQTDWNVETAASLYFEGGEQSPGPSSGSDSEDRDVEQIQPVAGRGRPQPPREKPKFATLFSMRNEDDDGEQGQAFYAGGSQRSGQQILGPPRRDRQNVVEDMFKSAKEHGADVVEPGDGPARQGRGGGGAFSGAGYKLGCTSDDTQTIPGADKPAPRRQKFVTLRLWQNGFSLDDGPLRGYDDEGSSEFLASIRQGEIPQELVREAQGSQVELDMEDRRDEDYVKPKVTLRPFSGAGHMLGSPVPPVGLAQGAAPVEKAELGAAPPPPAAQPEASAVEVDTSRPVTQLQIRLADGSRLVQKFNHTHKVSDIRNFIISRHPQYSGTTFLLMTTFPNKELTDETQTLQEASLINAVIVQRIK